MTYDRLLAVSDSIGLIAKEKDLQAYDGRIKGNRVAIRRTITTNRKKACVLAEELGHYFTSSGDILNDTVVARKQERQARLWAFNTQIGLSGLISANKAGCRNVYEAAEYLDVPENFLKDCIHCYHEKYGPVIRYHDYVIHFDPFIEIVTVEEDMRRTNDW